MVKYLISRTADPLFALFIGLSAAAVRIRREERGAGRDPALIMDTLKKRLGYYFGQ